MLHLKVGMRMPGAEREAEPSCLEWLELDGDTALTPHSERSDSLRSIRWVQGGISARLARPGAPCRALATQVMVNRALRIPTRSMRPVDVAIATGRAQPWQLRRPRRPACSRCAVPDSGRWVVTPKRRCQKQCCRDGWNAVRRACRELRATGNHRYAGADSLLSRRAPGGARTRAARLSMSLSLASSVTSHSASRCSAASIGPTAIASCMTGGAALVAAAVAGGGTSHLLPLASAAAGR